MNLFLRVMRRRDDGFHDLASLFHVIDLGDGMTLTARGGGAQEDCLACNMAGVPTDASNLVIKVPSPPLPPLIPATWCPAWPSLDMRMVNNGTGGVRVGGSGGSPWEAQTAAFDIAAGAAAAVAAAAGKS